MQNLIVKEQIRKKVARSGNGGAVWVPKDWLGEEIIVTRIETPKLSLEEEIINILLPYLKDISGIFLYGSYARKEEIKDSDIDVLVIAKNAYKIKNNKKFDINFIEIKKIREAVQKDPFIYAIINEAKPIINSYLLDELKGNKKNFKDFIKWFKETTNDSIKIAKEFIDLDEMESNYLTSYNVIYSVILRLRGIFLIKSVLNNDKFSNSFFKKFIIKLIPEFEFKKTYKIYKDLRDNKKIANVKIGIGIVKKLLEILEMEVKSLNDKQKK
ncbi:MAG: DUF2080 family transposase-associated protein [Nanoarchaeota archaeon]